MYIYCIENLHNILFNLKKGEKYIITNIYSESYAFYDHLNNKSDSIADFYLKDMDKYLKLEKGVLCTCGKKHWKVVFERIVCSKCHELIKLLEK